MKSTEPAIGQLRPLNDCVLVKTEQSSKNFTIKEGKYDSRTEGIVVATPQMFVSGKYKLEVEAIFGKRIFFEEFREGARIKRDGEEYSFIKIEDIRGYEEV